MECSGFCKNPASFPVTLYLIDFIDIAHTVHNFIRRTKLISSFFKEQIELIIRKITKFIFRSVFFHAIFWRGNSLILVYFQAFSTLRTPSWGSHHKVESRAPQIPELLGKHIIFWLRDDLFTLLFPFYKMPSIQNFWVTP